MIDSGIRRGTDVMKCLAFGASMVVVTRPLAWALHTNGYEGCKDIINILNDELLLAMALTHNFNLKEITYEKVIHQVKPRL
jgi:isopentenyl diphosphate isomerase/L-lactate dehydrogenase-like FMN-dependent dehydrogenase